MASDAPKPGSGPADIRSSDTFNQTETVQIQLIDGHRQPVDLFVDGIAGVMSSADGIVKFNMYEDRLNYRQPQSSDVVLPHRVIVAHVTMTTNTLVQMLDFLIRQVKTEQLPTKEGNDSTPRP